MKDYKRITERRKTPLTMSMWAGDSKSLQVYNRLAELEDKIESGELVSADEYESARRRAEIAERALATVCEEVCHARYPVESVTVSVVDAFIQRTLKEAEKELQEEGKE